MHRATDQRILNFQFRSGWNVHLRQDRESGFQDDGLCSHSDLTDVYWRGTRTGPLELNRPRLPTIILAGQTVMFVSRRR